MSPPSHGNIIGYKWVFKLKHKLDGKIKHYKAYLVSKAFNQTPSIDYFETFCPVVKPSAIRIVLFLVIFSTWLIRQLDIHITFLNGNLQEHVFMIQSPGFEDPQLSHHVCHLNKALYGFKQALRAWFTKLNNSLLINGF